MKKEFRRMAGCYVCGRVEFVSNGFRPHDLPCHQYQRMKNDRAFHNSWDWIENWIRNWNIQTKEGYTNKPKSISHWTQKMEF